MNDINLMNLAADNIRILTAAMVEKAKSGHPGGAMGGADFINVLYSEFLNYDPDDGSWMARDRFFLDPGHMSPMLYSTLAMAGKYSIEDIKNFRQWGSATPGHPERDLSRGIENTSGPLGQGHTYAVGAAIAAKFMQARFGSIMRQRIYAYISDGGIQEEISQGAGRIAGYLGLDNLVMFYDANDIQLSTPTGTVTSEDTAKKYEAWGWKVITINGNDVSEIRSALNEALQEKNHPTLIIGKTLMGKGARRADGTSYEACCDTHGAPLGGKAYENTILNLGGNLEDPFVIWDKVQAMYDARKEQLRALVRDWKQQKAEWQQEHQEENALMESYFSGKAPQIDWSAITQKRDAATRNGSAVILQALSSQVGNMAVSSADLCNSDKSEGFLKNTHIFTPGDFTGAFLQAGVSELTMTCVMMGMYLHGGMIPACATFFVFSDYMKPAIRMAALMEVPIKFIWSHDAFRVGEDGPTHQPVEQEVTLRLMEKLKNHSGKNSILVLRPADTDETTVCWQMAMENMSTPTALIFSRQNVESLPEGNPYQMARKGGYIVEGSQPDPDVILIASGSEVSTLVQGSKLLKEDGIKVRIVSLPSEGLFRNQPKAYQDEVLTPGVPRFGLTAGMPATLESIVGENGKVWGLDHFGYSAPYKVLDEKFGFTAQNVYEQVKKMLQ